MFSLDIKGMMHVQNDWFYHVSYGMKQELNYKHTTLSLII